MSRSAVPFPPINKNLALAPIRPNLVDYAAVRAAFDWADARARLDGLPGGRGLEHRARGGRSPRGGPRAERIALRWLGKDGERRDFTYRELAAETNRFANAPGRPRRRPGRPRLRAARAGSRALHRGARRAEGQVRRLAAVLRLRSRADRHPPRDRRGRRCWSPPRRSTAARSRRCAGGSASWRR